VSAMALFVGLGIEGSTLFRGRRLGSVDPGESAGSGLRWAQRFGGPGMGLTVLAGLYLAATQWGWREAWIDAAMGGVVLVGAVWGTMTGARLARLRREGRSVPLTDPVLWRSLTIRAGLLVGVIFLMTVKPGLAVSLIALGIGLAAGLLAGRLRRQPEPPAA
jgi:hypothetical protein